MKLKCLLLMIFFNTVFSYGKLIKGLPNASLSKTNIGLTMLVGILGWKLLKKNKEMTILKLNQNNQSIKETDLSDICSKKDCLIRYNQLLETLKTSNNSNQALNTDLLNLKCARDKLQNDNTILHGEILTLKHSETLLKNQQAFDKKSYEELHSKYLTMLENNRRLESEINTHKSTISDLEIKISRLNLDGDLLNNKVQRYEKQIEGDKLLKKCTTNYEEKSKQLLEQNKQLQAEVAKLQSFINIAQLAKQKGEEGGKAASLIIQKNLDEFMQENQQLQIKCFQLKNEIDKKSALLLAKEQQVQCSLLIENKWKESIEKNKMLQDEINKLNEQVNRLKHNENIINMVKNSNAESIDLMNSTYKNMCEEFDEENKKLKLENTDLMEKNETLGKELREKIKFIDDEIKTIKQKEENELKYNAEMRNECNQFLNENTEKIDMIKSWSEGLLKETIEKNNELKAEIDRLKKEIEILQNNNQKFNFKSENTFKDCENIFDQKTSQMDKDVLLNQQTTDLKIENSKLKEEILRLKGQIEDANMNQSLIDLLKQQAAENNKNM